MANAPGRQKRKDDSLQDRFNRLLDDVFSAGPRFQMRKLEEFEQTAVSAREDQVMSARPKKVRELPLPSLREDPLFTKAAVAAALDLAERMEMARKPSDLDLHAWAAKEVVI